MSSPRSPSGGYRHPQQLLQGIVVRRKEVPQGLHNLRSHLDKQQPPKNEQRWRGRAHGRGEGVRGAAVGRSGAVRGGRCPQDRERPPAGSAKVSRKIPDARTLQPSSRPSWSRLTSEAGGALEGPTCPALALNSCFAPARGASTRATTAMATLLSPVYSQHQFTAHGKQQHQQRRKATRTRVASHLSGKLCLLVRVGLVAPISDNAFPLLTTSQALHALHAVSRRHDSPAERGWLTRIRST